jgi:NAD(P)-dependent dehydrogenase (short-subunit alcohol dehydrogenase family)
MSGALGVERLGSPIVKLKTRTSNMTILQGKRAVIFGAGGSIGGATAKLFAREGAELYLSGRNLASVQHLADEITDAGGKAAAAVVDAESATQVADYMDAVARAGAIDVVFNATGPRIGAYHNGQPATELPADAFMVPLDTLVKSQFITSQAAARHMVKHGAGVIVFLTGSPSRGHVRGATAIGAAFGAIETFMENLAFELGPSGVRAVCVRITANVDSRTIEETMQVLESRMGVTRKDSVARLAAGNFLNASMKVDDTARALAFVSSDNARLLTATVVNSSAGAALD